MGPLDLDAASLGCSLLCVVFTVSIFEKHSGLLPFFFAICLALSSWLPQGIPRNAAHLAQLFPWRVIILFWHGCNAFLFPWPHFPVGIGRSSCYSVNSRLPAPLRTSAVPSYFIVSHCICLTSDTHLRVTCVQMYVKSDKMLYLNSFLYFLLPRKASKCLSTRNVVFYWKRKIPLTEQVFSLLPSWPRGPQYLRNISSPNETWIIHKNWGHGEEPSTQATQGSGEPDTQYKVNEQLLGTSWYSKL